MATISFPNELKRTNDILCKHRNIDIDIHECKQKITSAPK